MHATVGHVNLYNIYGDCISGSEEHAYGAAHPKAGNAPSMLGLGGPDACINSILGSAWMNQPAVLAAAHVVPQPFNWSTCGNQIHYTTTRPNLPRDTYPFLISRIRVVVYNGDWDACVPFTDNEAWTEAMGFPVAAPWHAWTYRVDGGSQVAGYATVYDTPTNFSFVTVRGGRHEVPETAPGQAAELLRRLLANEAF